MYVIEVIPFIRATTLESLSYYSATDYPTGTILTVPVRKREVTGMVVNAEPVSAAKAALRSATFSLRKLTPQPDAPCLPDSIIATATALSKTTPAHLGSILFALLPPDIRSGVRDYPFTTNHTNTECDAPHVLTATAHDRHIAYRSYIRQAFAHRGSVLFVVPHSAAVHTATEALSKGIEKRVVTFSSTHTKKQIAQSYDAFTDFSTAKLIITTPNFALLDRHDITNIIIEEAASPHYKAKTRPYLDARDVLTCYAAATKRNVLFGDTLVRTEEEVLRREDVYATFDEHVNRLNFNNTFRIATPPKPVRSEPFTLLTEELRDTISTTLKAKGRTFLLAARRGFSPLIICNDCGHVLRCQESGAPFTLYTKQLPNGDEERWLYCSTSGVRQKAFDTCPVCTSWRLREQGIGIQKAVAHVRRHFPDTPIITFDHTSASTHPKALRLAKQFYGQKGVIMVGTSMAVPYLTEPVHTTGVLSLEAMRATPSWRVEEQVLRNLLMLRELSQNHFVVQTRDPDDPLLQHCKRGSIDDFYQEEINMRQMLSYPPYTTLIHLTWQGNKEQLKETEEQISAALGHIDMQCYNSGRPSKVPVRHALIKVARADWPDEDLVNRLRSLPPAIRIETSPDRII